MSFKTILVHCDASEQVGRRLDVAADLSRRFDATLLGVHANIPFEPPLIVGRGPGLACLVQAHRTHAIERQAASRAAFEYARKGKPIAAEWRSEDGYADQVVTRCSSYADLVILGQALPAGTIALPVDLPECVAFGSGRPVLVVPYGGVRKTVGKTVLLCWNASREAARAAADAMPFLRSADEVIVLVIEPNGARLAHGQEPGADVATWLARHGVKVRVQHDIAPDVDVGNAILSRAADYGADLIVMGIYGHSRLREMVLGGVSRTLLSSMTLPVLMSH
jgi:nucleotide-binding universal stress UspA family protein